MLDDHYTIKLCGGKYTVINHRNRLELLRYDEAWPNATATLQHNNVVYAMAQRIEELEKTIRDVLDGSRDARQQRNGDGMNSYAKLGPDAEGWRERLTNVLEQKP